MAFFFFFSCCCFAISSHLFVALHFLFFCFIWLAVSLQMFAGLSIYRLKYKHIHCFDVIPRTYFVDIAQCVPKILSKFLLRYCCVTVIVVLFISNLFSFSSICSSFRQPKIVSSIEVLLLPLSLLLLANLFFSYFFVFFFCSFLLHLIPCSCAPDVAFCSCDSYFVSTYFIVCVNSCPIFFLLLCIDVSNLTLFHMRFRLYVGWLLLMKCMNLWLKFICWEWRIAK